MLWGYMRKMGCAVCVGICVRIWRQWIPKAIRQWNSPQISCSDLSGTYKHYLNMLSLSYNDWLTLSVPLFLFVSTISPWAVSTVRWRSHPTTTWLMCGEYTLRLTSSEWSTLWFTSGQRKKECFTLISYRFNVYYPTSQNAHIGVDHSYDASVVERKMWSQGTT